MMKDKKRTIVSNYMNTDMVIKNDTIFNEEEKDIIDESFVKVLRENDGVLEVHSLLFSKIIVPWEPDFAEMWMKESYEKWMSVPYSQHKDEYQNHPENFGSCIIRLGL